MSLFKPFFTGVFLSFLILASYAHGVSVRFACFGLSNSDQEFQVIWGDDRIMDVKVPRVGFSKPMDIPARTLYVNTENILPAENGAITDQQLEVSLPEKGGAFIILLMELPEAGIRPLVLPSDSKNFQGGDVMFFNLTGSRVGIKLGEESLVLNAYSKQVKRPPQMEDDGDYQVQFIAEKNGRSKLFSATRWLNQYDTRDYIFILQKPGSGRFYYKAMSELLEKEPQQAVEKTANN